MNEHMRKTILRPQNAIYIVNLTHADRLILVEKLVEMKVSHTASSSYTYNVEKDERTYRHTITISRLKDAQALDIVDMLKAHGAEYELGVSTSNSVSS